MVAPDAMVARCPGRETWRVGREGLPSHNGRIGSVPRYVNRHVNDQIFSDFIKVKKRRKRYTYSLNSAHLG